MGDRLLAVGLLAVQHCRLPRHGAAGAGAELGRRLGPLGKALALLHRLLCLKKAAVAGRPAPAAVPSEGGDGGSDAATAAVAVAATGFEQWDGLWDALIGLLGRLTPDSEAGSPAGGPGAALVGVWAQLLNLLNLAVTYGHQLLPTVAHYDRLLYELLRAQPAFGRLQKAAAALGDGGGAAAVVLRPLANAVAIAAQIGRGVPPTAISLIEPGCSAGSHCPGTAGLDATMEVDELLPLIAAGRSKLQVPPHHTHTLTYTYLAVVGGSRENLSHLTDLLCGCRNSCDCCRTLIGSMRTPKAPLRLPPSGEHCTAPVCCILL